MLTYRRMVRRTTIRHEGREAVIRGLAARVMRYRHTGPSKSTGPSRLFRAGSRKEGNFCFACNLSTPRLNGHTVSPPDLDQTVWRIGSSKRCVKVVSLKTRKRTIARAHPAPLHIVVVERPRHLLEFSSRVTRRKSCQPLRASVYCHQILHESALKQLG